MHRCAAIAAFSTSSLYLHGVIGSGGPFQTCPDDVKQYGVCEKWLCAPSHLVCARWTSAVGQHQRDNGGRITERKRTSQPFFLFFQSLNKNKSVSMFYYPPCAAGEGWLWPGVTSLTLPVSLHSKVLHVSITSGPAFLTNPCAKKTEQQKNKPK